MSTASSNAAPKRRRRLWVAGIVVLATVAAVLALALIPIPHSFSESLSTGPLGKSQASFGPPAGSGVSGSWSTEGVAAHLQIADSAGLVIYSANASSGSFEFTAASPPYTFSVYSLPPAFVFQPVNVSGSASYPILWIH
jgi:hypothetical protein